ncbi:putative transporter SVOPL [Battus philenor]|uniref:putative transporter SVOPL n=1 Tax=Battus philenor TaxID=42288 RepID=UPI0035CF1C79
MYSKKIIEQDKKVHFETALEMAGFGCYSYYITALIGFLVIAFVCIVYGITIIIPASACELETTNAQQGYIAAGPVVGAVLGGIVGGFLGDKFGRRRMLFITLLSSSLMNALASISVNWIMLLILQFIASFCAGSIYTLSMTILSESVAMSKRNLVVLLVTSIFLLSQGVMAVIAIPIIPLTFSIYLPALDIYWNSWRTLLLVYSIPNLLGVLGLLFLMESPKYMFSQGYEREAVDIIKAIHRMNRGRSAGELKINGLILDAQEINAAASTRNQIVPLFKMPLLKYTIIMSCLFLFNQIGAFAVWLPTIANQFVDIVQTGEGTNKSLCAVLSDSMNTPVDPDAVPCSLNMLSLLIVLVVGALKSVINALLSLVVNRVGRRNMAMIVVIIASISGIVTNLIPNAYASGVFFIIFLVGVLIMGLYTAITLALFPTHLRALAVAVAMTAGRIGTFVSVQILNMLLETNCDVGFYVFSSILASSAIVAAILPDDRRLRKQENTE